MTTTEGTMDLDPTLNTDWQMVDRETKYKSLQSDYTRKTQELSDLKKQPQTQAEIDEETLEKRVQSRGFVKQDEVVNLKRQIEEENKFKDLLTYNPDLWQYADAISTLAKAENLAYEDVIEKYKFWSVDKLKKAKESRMIGDKNLDTKTLNIADATPEQWAEWKQKNTWKWSMFTTAGRI